MEPPKPCGPRRKTLALGALLLALGVAAAGAPAAQADDGPLCGITQVTDRLLDCDEAEQGEREETTTHATTTEPATTTAPAPAPAPGIAAAQTLAAGPPLAISSTRPTYLPGTLIVRFRRGVSASRADALLARLGARTKRTIGALGVRVVTMRPARRAHVQAALARSPLVAKASRDEILHALSVAPNDANFGLQWGLKLANFTAAWQRTHGKRIVVAVLDTGVTVVPDIAGNVRKGVNLVTPGTPPTDDNGHGTAVAGVIAAHANNHLGGAGVCWACSIVPIKVMGADGNGDLATVAAGIVKAADLHARVIDLSLGGTAPLDTLKSAVDYATAKGAVVVAAAGNAGRGVPYYPANYPNVISVAGSTSSDRLYGWSEHGTWINVAAPGCNVAPLNHGGYGMFCGTSSATPLVAGLAALVLSVKPHATTAQIATAIRKSARRIPSVRYGRIDAAKTLARLR